VFDGYGLNDGGLSAFECSEHSGMHIDTERGLLQVVSDDGSIIDNGEGSITATSLINYAMPLIRYSTGDVCEISNSTCACGRSTRLITEIKGRSVDVFYTPDKKLVHGWYFLYVFWEYCKGIKEYQVIQNKIDLIEVKIVPDKDFNPSILNDVRRVITATYPSWSIEFKIVDKIPLTNAGKYKFIISNVRAPF
jgi:phenylacetate-CoA ligase